MRLISQTKIESIFAELDRLLADGRSYLLGRQLTLVDYCLAALAAPVLLPGQFRGVPTTFAQLPAAYRLLRPSD